MRPATILRAGFLSLLLLSFVGGLHGVAGEHPPTGSPTPRPVPLSGLRPTAIQTAPISVTDAGTDSGPLPARTPSKKELVLLVGGYGSAPDDGYFNALRARFPADRYEVRQFGTESAFPYDSYGRIDPSADSLIAEIRSVRSEYSAVNIVSHSMGGVVVDRAFERGLSNADGVRTHVSLAAPHSGDKFARTASFLLPRLGRVQDLVRAFFFRVLQDPGGAAVPDLATRQAAPPPPGVARLDISLATDVMVSPDDAQDPGVEQRVLLPTLQSIEGHSGVPSDPQVLDLVYETIRTHQVPPETRPLPVVVASGMVWDASEDVSRWLLLALELFAISVFLLSVAPGVQVLVSALNQYAKAYLRAHGR